MKFSVALSKDIPGAEKNWKDAINDGWFKDCCGLSKWRVANVIDAVAKESGQRAWFVEIESGILSYLNWIFQTRILHNKRMILPGWISEKGALRS